MQRHGEIVMAWRNVIIVAMKYPAAEASKKWRKRQLSMWRNGGVWREMASREKAGEEIWRSVVASDSNNQA